MIAESAGLPLQAHELTSFALLFLVLRAFASGYTALSGVEAISNVAPYFRPPKSRNAAAALVIMGPLAVTMFYGVTLLAAAAGVQHTKDPAALGLPPDYVQPTVIAQLGSAVFGAGSFGFYFLQITTMAMLVLAANAAYNSFPQLASVRGAGACPDSAATPSRPLCSSLPRDAATSQSPLHWEVLTLSSRHAVTNLTGRYN